MKRKPSVRATRRQSSGSDHGRIERELMNLTILMAEAAWWAERKKLTLAQARIQELEAKLSKRKVLRRSK